MNTYLEVRFLTPVHRHMVSVRGYTMIDNLKTLMFALIIIIFGVTIVTFYYAIFVVLFISLAILIGRIFVLIDNEANTQI